MITVFHQNRDATFTRVATVDTHDLDQAWYLTNSIDWPWVENPGVEAYADRVRSTSVGDVFYTHGNGQFHKAVSFGFESVALDGQLLLTFGELRCLLGAQNV